MRDIFEVFEKGTAKGDFGMVKEGEDWEYEEQAELEEYTEEDLEYEAGEGDLTLEITDENELKDLMEAEDEARRYEKLVEEGVYYD